METEELLTQLNKRDIVIFGAGFVAEMFYEALVLHGLEERLRLCVVSRAAEGQRFHGIPVRSLRKTQLPAEALVCLAVHESAVGDVRAALPWEESRVVWIYPHLFSLLYGSPAAGPAAVPAVDILRCQGRGDYWIAVRYAAIRDYLACSSDWPCTRELYTRALALHCDYATAVRRGEQMEKLAEAMATGGYRSDCPIRIDEAGRIIDGLHRFACVLYLGISTIPAVVYPVSPVYERLLGERNRLTEPVLRSAGFTEEEMAFLRTAAAEAFSRADRASL